MKKTQAKVLVMDDDANIQVLLRRILKSMEHTVNCADDGEAALKKYKDAHKSSRPFDVVILDLVIPNGMGGIQTMQELKKINPEVKVIVSSGYLQDVNIHPYKNYGFFGILKKPYTVDEVINLINSCLSTC